MILSGPEIRARLGNDIIIEPFDQAQLNPNSYNLRLHGELQVYRNRVLDISKPNPTDRLEIPDDGLVLEPGRLYLGRTMERTITHNLVPMLEGRSSIGRLGLSVHASAGFGDVGFDGYWTLQIATVQPIRIFKHIKICQIFYHQVHGALVTYDGGKYQGNRDIQPSMIYREFGPDLTDPPLQ
ncbi:MAG: dCTP deaminase [Acidobacteria bacterium]|nr:dCTP deaminase [Acidobacteriota bacterium]